MLELYADGGVIKKNPSPIGGTWAWVLVENDKILDRGCGIFVPEQNGLFVTNNQTELEAIIRGLGSLYDDELAKVFSDSEVTLGRVFRGSTFNNIPKEMKKRLDFEKKRLKRFSEFPYELLHGHPTKKQLENGFGKNGHPTSKWNVLCDEMCRQVGEEYYKEFMK